MLKMSCDFYMFFLPVSEWVTKALVFPQMLLQAFYAGKS